MKDFFTRHELQLRLQMLTLKDIWLNLMAVETRTAGALPLSTNLWEGMEALAKNELVTIVVNSFKEELPEDKESNYGFFFLQEQQHTHF